MSLFENIYIDMIDATKAQKEDESQILKMALAAIKNEEIAKGIPLSDDDIIKVLRKETKKIQESIDQFSKMNRLDLLKKEEIQLNTLQKYLPKLMDNSQIEEIVSLVIKESGAQGMKDIGKIMGLVMKQVNGRADGNIVREIVEKKLS